MNHRLLANRWIVALALLAGCLAVPPAVEPRASAPSDAPASPPVPIPIPTPDQKQSSSLVACPINTGKIQLCKRGLHCERDKYGCEQCICNEYLDGTAPTREPSPGMDPRDRELE